MRKRKPFIVWTLQRTGGTNLAQRLFGRSKLLDIYHKSYADRHPRLAARLTDNWKLHEPFNSGEQARVFGHVTEAWLRTGDKQGLARAMDKICRLRLPIKHCVEMVPWEVNEALIEASGKAGYRQLFLYRRNALNRLLSLHFAEKSGIWGAHFRGGAELTDEFFAEPLPIERLVDHEKLCNARLTRIWQALEAKGCAPCAVAFEDIYRTDVASTDNHVLFPVLAYLNLSHGKQSDQAFIDKIVETGGQGTRDEYNAFAGIAQLAKALESVVMFSPVSKLYTVELEPLYKNDARILWAEIDVLPTLSKADTAFALGGVVVLNEPVSTHDTLKISVGRQQRAVLWGIPSPGITKKLPGGYNNVNARFKVNKVHFDAVGGEVKICLHGAGGEVVPIFNLRLRCNQI